MSILIATAVSALLAAFAGWITWHINQSVLQAGCSKGSNVCAALVGISWWTISLILFANVLQVPGYFGPVQYIPQDSLAGQTLFFLRGLTFLIMLCVPIIVAVVYSTSSDDSSNSDKHSLHYVVPAISVISYLGAWKLMMEYQFFPTV